MCEATTKHTFSMAADAVLGSDSLEPNELGYKYIYKEQVLHMYSLDMPRGPRALQTQGEGGGQVRPFKNPPGGALKQTRHSLTKN